MYQHRLTNAHMCRDHTTTAVSYQSGFHTGFSERGEEASDLGFMNHATAVIWKTCGKFVSGWLILSSVKLLKSDGF